MYTDLSQVIYHVEWSRLGEDIQRAHQRIAGIFIHAKDLGVITSMDIEFLFGEPERLCRVINAMRAINARPGSGRTLVNREEYELAAKFAACLNNEQRECLSQYNDSYCNEVKQMVREALEV